MTLHLDVLPSYFDKATVSKYVGFVNYYIHQVNAMRFLFGEPYKLTFADKGETILVAESDSGVCGVIETAPYSNSIDWQETYFVSFERGYVKIDLPAPLAPQQPGRVFIMRDKNPEIPPLTEVTLPKVSAMRNQAKNFVLAVKGEKTAPCVSKEALEDLKIARDYINMLKNS